MRASDITSSIKEFLRAADIGRSRSSILNQLQWAMAILMAGIVAIVFAHGPSWLIIFLAVLLALDAAVFFIAFLYFMRKRPHSLRSESHDYKITELTQNRQVSEFIQRRDRQIEEGLYEEVLDASKLKR